MSKSEVVLIYAGKSIVYAKSVIRVNSCVRGCTVYGGVGDAIGYDGVYCAASGVKEVSCNESTAKFASWYGHPVLLVELVSMRLVVLPVLNLLAVPLFLLVLRVEMGLVRCLCLLGENVVPLMRLMVRAFSVTVLLKRLRECLSDALPPCMLVTTLLR